mgnify:CR=1 FL=1
MAQLRPKIVKLAKIIGGVTGITTKIDENAPEYYCMAGILSDDEADIAIAAGLRKERTAGYLAKKVGKTVEEIAPLLDNLVYYGIFRRSMDKALGEDVYYMQIFAPGILEMMVNQKELLETHPEVGRAFEEYTRNLAANMGAMIPDGYGLMRVIPVESALEGIEGVSDYERISHYLDKYDRFSVSPCSCRASRSSLGDGCGHLEEDMCVQMGRGAEHYIRTGRAREITREQALEITEALVRSGAIDVVVVDSVAALVPRAEIEGEMGDSYVGLQARLMSQALRKLTGVIGKTNTVCIFINQLREKVGVVYGNPEVTTGGRALKYYSSVRIDVRRIEGLKDSTGAFIGNRTRAKIVKNKVAPPFREAEFDIMFGEGISKIGEILDLGVKLGVVQKSGAWFNYGEMRLGQGRDNAKQFLKDHPEVSDEIEKIVRANSDRLLAAGKKGTVKPLDPSEVIKPAAAAEAPAAPAAKTTGSEVDLDIMVDE